MKKNLPKNWVNAKLNDLSTIQSGGTPSRSKSQYWSGDIPWVKISDLKEWFVSSTTEFITEEGLNNSSTKIFPKGTILFTIFATIGKVGVLDIDACTNQAIAGITPVEEIEHKFLTYSLIELAEILKSEGKGVAQKNINLTILKDLNVPLPPLAEQQRIVAKLDVLFNHLDTLKTRLDHIPQLLKNFRQAVLTQAVTGKLTEEWRVGKELEKIDYVKIHKDRIHEFDAFKKENKKKGLKSPNKPEYLNHKIESVKNFSIASWLTAPVGFLCDCIVPGRDKPKSFTGDIPWITTPDLKSNFIYSNNAKLFLSKAEVLEVRAKLIPKNSVVISIVGRFGVSCVIKDACVINQQLHAFLPSEYVLPEYLMYYFKTQEDEMNSISTSTTIAYINKTKANSIVVNVPPKQEQIEIVKRVESLFAKTDTIETQYQSLKAKIDSLPQSILAKAFKGELVEQLDSDGSAEVLLEEIQKLKEVASQNKKPLKKIKSLRGAKQSVK